MEVKYPQQYSTFIDKFKAVPKEEIIPLRIPAEIAAQEAKTLYFQADKDREALMAAGLKASIIDELLPASEAFYTTEAIWKIKTEEQKVNLEKWKTQSPYAFDLREHLFRAMRYAFRNNTELLKLLSDIKDGYTNADLISDLHGLSLLGQRESALMGEINFDMSFIESAGTMATDMGNLLARATGERSDDNDAKVIRDKASVYVSRLVKEIRDCGKYVFWNDEKKLMKYRSDYSHKKYLSYKNSGTKPLSPEQEN
jgi:hypothetical protein